MALTSNDETDLLLPLFRGMHEHPRFATFLDRLRRRTGARHVALVGPGQPADPISAAILPPNHGAARLLRPFRVYAQAELRDIDQNLADRRATLADSQGIEDSRLARIPLPEGTHGWLLIARDRACTAADSALLSSLAPYVQSVLAASMDLAREHAAASLGSLGLERAGVGWTLFDADARVLAMDARLRARLAAHTGLETLDGERLRGVPTDGERRLVDAAAAFARQKAQSIGHATILARPRLDLVLQRIDPDSAEAARFPQAVMVALARFAPAGGDARSRVLAGLHDLPMREAELAVALADGLSIADAARKMGLTIETARNYSKRLYAKLDVSGQAQLVRLVHRSGAALV